MTVHFLTFSYPPMKYPRSIQINHLVKYSRHSVSVICGDDNGGKDPSIDEGIPGRPASKIVIPQDTAPAGPIARVLDRLQMPDRQRSWARHVVSLIHRERVIRKGDVLVTFGQPMSDHLAGLELKRKLGLCWIAHFSDPWADSPYRHPIPFVRTINRHLERKVVETADRTIFTSKETVDLVFANYSDTARSRAAILPHAYDPARVVSAATADNEKVVIRHIGNFYGARSPEPLLHALLRLHDERPAQLAGVSLEFIGHRSHRQQIDPLIERLPDDLVRFIPPVDYAQSQRLTGSAHALVVIDAPFETSVFLPSKLIDYVGAARPILAITPPGTTADLVRRLGGFIAHPLNNDEIETQLLAVVNAARMLREKPFGDQAVRELYAAPVVATAFDDLVDEVSRTAL